VKEREEGFLSGKGDTAKNQKAKSSFICSFILSLSLSLCNLECRKRYWSHGMCQHTPAEQYLKRAPTVHPWKPLAAKSEDGQTGEGVCCRRVKGHQGEVVALAQSAGICINTIKLSHLLLSQAFLQSCWLWCSPKAAI